MSEKRREKTPKKVNFTKRNARALAPAERERELGGFEVSGRPRKRKRGRYLPPREEKEEVRVF